MDASLTLRPIAGLSISVCLQRDRHQVPPGSFDGGWLGGLQLGGTGFGLGGDVLVDLNTHKSFDGPKLLVGGGLEFSPKA